MNRRKTYSYRFRKWVNMHSLYKVAALSLALLSPSQLGSTAILAFIRSDRIVIATYAMSTLIHSTGGVGKTKICKIYQSGSVFFAFAGLDQDDNIGFISSELAKKGTALSLKARAEQFARDVKSPLLQSLQGLYGKSRQMYQKAIPGSNALEAIFAGMEGGGASFYTIEMNTVEGANGRPIGLTVATHSCPGDACPTKTESVMPIFMGDWEAANHEYMRMRDAGDKRLVDDVATLTHLIKTEILASPDLVGPPVAVVTINSFGAYWNPQGECGIHKKQSGKKQTKK
jgi:hypothetical protein